MLWKQACAHTEHTASPADRRLRMLLESFCVGNIVGAQKAGSAFVVLRALVLFPLVLRAAAQGEQLAPGTFKPAAGNAACLWCGHGGSGETGAGAERPRVLAGRAAEREKSGQTTSGDAWKGTACMRSTTTSSPCACAPRVTAPINQSSA